MSFRLGVRNGISVIWLEEGVNATAATEVGHQIDELLEIGKTIMIIDVSKAKYVDTNGLKLLLSIKRKCEENSGSMTVVCNDNSRVRRSFELTGLDATLSVHNNMEEAIVSITG